MSRGGKRLGAGRPKLKDTYIISIRFELALKDKNDKLLKDWCEVSGTSKNQSLCTALCFGFEKMERLLEDTLLPY